MRQSWVSVGRTSMDEEKRGGKHGVHEQRKSWGEFGFDYRIATDMDRSVAIL